jgi:glycine reductase
MNSKEERDLLKILHYINQFYGGIGGEEHAGHLPEMREGAHGPGMAFAAAFGDAATITHTIVCGDSYFGENLEAAKQTILDMVRQVKPDMFIAGPAFNAGRYGVACGTICDAVKTELGIPVLTGMYVENPGAEMFVDKMHIISTRDSGAGMREAVPKMAKLALKLARGEKIGASIEEGYMPGYMRVNFFEKERGSKRAVDMLLAKMKGEPFVTEFPMPDFDRVEPLPPIADITKARVALVTSGGIVPKGNPDRIEASSASKYGEYDIAGVGDLTEATYETAHGGYDPTYANVDADRVLPVDVLREMETAGKIGSLHNKFYTTTGNGTAVKSSAAFAVEFAAKLKNDGVDAVILTST